MINVPLIKQKSYLQSLIDGPAGDGDVLGVEDNEVCLFTHREDQLLNA